MGTAATKADLRRRLSATRREMSPESLVTAADSLCAHLINFISGYAGTTQTPDDGELTALLATRASAPRRVARPTVIAAYSPTRTEPGGSELPRRLLLPGVKLLLPVLLPDLDLDWAQYSGDLVAGEGLPEPPGVRSAGRGLLEPPGPRLGVTEIATAEIVLVPALAVDRQGHRLGKGGGSYDRALARICPSALVVALLHDGELLDEVPAEPHDRPVNAVATPTGITPLR